MASPSPQSLKGKSAVTSNSVTQMVNMHMEKVARREIGTLATVQRLPPGQKIITPESLPHLTPYYRRPLNFSCLDDIGHGIKVERGAPPLSPSFFIPSLCASNLTRQGISLIPGCKTQLPHLFIVFISVPSQGMGVHVHAS